MRVLFLTFFVGLCGILFGQKPFYFIENGSVYQIDTVSLNEVEDYGQEDFVINLGNHGSPEYNLKPELNDLITNDYSLLTYQPTHSFRRYKLYKPIVDAKYVIGTSQEQHFSLLHSQNISKKVNYAVGLNKINSKGIYQNQQTNFTDVFFNSYGEDLLKNRYSYGLQFNYLNAAASLNGGLVDDSTFINDTLNLQNRELLDVNLLYAYQEKKKWYGKFQHSFKVMSKLDSNQNGNILMALNHFQYEYSSRLFYDSLLNADFYDRIISDSSITSDLLSYQKLEGFLGMKFIHRKEVSNAMSFELGTNVSENQYNQETIDTSRLDVSLHFDGSYYKSNFSAYGKADYLLNDTYAKKDYNVDVGGRYVLGGVIEVNMRAYWSNERPQLDLLRYTSNHVSWTNSFQKYQIQHYMIGAKYVGKWDVSLSVNYFDIRNPIYFGYDKTPYQAIGVAQLIRTSVSVNNKDNKRWDLGAQAHYQYQGGYNIFRLPEVLSKVRAAYKFKAFKKKMSAAIGTEIIYFSKYQSKSFDPVSGQYFIYSNGELGNYPYMNLFLKSRVQRATFFVMMSHPHQGLFGYNYFYAPSYPANDRFFRIGVSWLFVN